MRRESEARIQPGTPGAGEMVGLAAPSGSTNAGHSINRYALLGEIASGGMATVHLARLRGASGFERTVAVKRCHPHLRSDPHFQEMLVDEARLAANIHHPNVVATLDVIPGEALSVVMEYVEGGPLSELIAWTRARQAQLPLEVVLRLTLDLLQGLHAAHTLRGLDGQPLGLVHRDVSPQNVLVSTDGVARLADFGVAKANARVTVTREGQIKGKVPYMAPEVLLGMPITAQLDLYAAGVVLWEALTCTRLFAADSESELWDRVLRGVIMAPSALRPELPREIDDLVLRSLSLDAAKRPASALAFAEAVERVSTELGIRIASQRTVALLAHQAFAETISRHRALCTAPVRPTGTALPALVPEPPQPAARRGRGRIALFALITVVIGGAAWLIGRAGAHRPSTGPATVNLPSASGPKAAAAPAAQGMAAPGTKVASPGAAPSAVNPAGSAPMTGGPSSPAAANLGAANPADSAPVTGGPSRSAAANPAAAGAALTRPLKPVSKEVARPSAPRPTRRKVHRHRRRRAAATAPQTKAKSPPAPAGNTLFQPDGI